MSWMKWISASLIAALVLTGCGSSKIKERKEQRERVAQTSKLYCEFINGEIFPDIDVALNLEMAKRCDSDRPFSISSYRTPSENQGVLYCCSTGGKSTSGSDRPKKSDKKEIKETKEIKESKESKDEIE